MNNAQEFVESVCKLLVERSEEVLVERKVDDMGVLLTISVGESEYGKIIGKEGNIIRAIRTLARVIGIPVGLIVYALADFGGLYNRILIKLGIFSKCCEAKVIAWDLYHNSCGK